MRNLTFFRSQHTEPLILGASKGHGTFLCVLNVRPWEQQLQLDLFVAIMMFWSCLVNKILMVALCAVGANVTIESLSWLLLL